MNLKNLTTYIGSIPNVKVEVNDDYIVIKNHTVAFYPDAPVFISIPKNAEDLNDISMWHLKLSGIGPKELAHIFNAIMSYINTPIKERYPEKKYRLRWINDNDGTPTYLGIGTISTWVFHIGKGNADVFTESEVQKLKEENPRFAKTIEIMKESVDD